MLAIGKVGSDPARVVRCAYEQIRICGYRRKARIRFTQRVAEAHQNCGNIWYSASYSLVGVKTPDQLASDDRLTLVFAVHFAERFVTVFSSRANFSDTLDWQPSRKFHQLRYLCS